MQKELIYRAYRDLESSIKLLETSLSKYKPYNPETFYTYEDLEYYDSLSFRYEKAIEAVFYFFKTLETYLYGERSETYRSMLQRIEKLDLIEDTEAYMDMKILRNKVVHTYTPEKLEEIYSNIEKFGNILIRDFRKIKQFMEESI